MPQESQTLIELVMHTTGRTYFESARFIRAREQAVQPGRRDVNKALVVKPAIHSSSTSF
jgi:hypothetical protein